MAIPTDSARELTRHALAALVYRGGKTLRDVPAGFSEFRASPASRSAGQILAHVCDLFDWSVHLARGEKKWHESPPRSWAEDSTRFFEGARALDDVLATAPTIACPLERLLQGPIADALTHVGQISLLRRLANAPVRGENYFVAEIRAGRVGKDQPPPVFEFD